MAFSELEQQLIKQTIGAFCERRSPDHLRDKLEIRYRLDGQAVTIMERRPRFQTPGEYTESPFARFRYNRRAGVWTLFWSDNRGRWHEYERVEPTRDLKLLITEVEGDPTGIFWG